MRAGNLDWSVKEERGRGWNGDRTREEGRPVTETVRFAAIEDWAIERPEGQNLM